MGTKRAADREHATLAVLVPVSDSGAPKEFRLFEAGWNETSKGSFLFDELAARSVMAAYETHGVDKMLDLEHLSLDPTSSNYDSDARAWFSLEVRGGELWAVNVRWTSDGLRRLTEKTQRYVSPAFEFDIESMRILEIVNVALTSLPATFGTPALIAANTNTKRAAPLSTEVLNMTPEMVKKALDALIAGDTDAAADILKAMVAEAAGAEEAAPPEAPPEEMAGEVAPLAEDGEEDAEEMAAVVAASQRLTRITGQSTMSGAVEEVERWRQSHLTIEKERAQLAADRLAIESVDRRKLVAELVKLGVELPATAWEDEAGTKPVARLASEPLADLRKRVEVLSKAKPASKVPRPPTQDNGAEPGSKTFSVDGKTVTLSASELEACADSGAKPEHYAANKLARLSR